MELRLIETLRRINRGVALVVGFGLLACAAFILTDIVMRQIGEGLGGTEEIAGYAMALATSWGMAYTLLELGHVRIDILRGRAGSFGRALFDLFSMTLMAGKHILQALLIQHLYSFHQTIEHVGCGCVGKITCRVRAYHFAPRPVGVGE